MGSRSKFAAIFGKRSRNDQRRSSDFMGRRPLRLEALEHRRMLALIVTTHLDSAPAGYTLREAIADANASPTTSDTIEFAPSLSGQTIQLTGGELSVTSPIVINNTLGRGNLTIKPDVNTASAGDGDRAFYVTAGSLTLQNIKISGGDIGEGIIEAYDPNTDPNPDLTYIPLTIINSDIVGGPGTFGSGVVSHQFVVTVTNSTITGHSGYGLQVGKLGGKSIVTASTISGNGQSGIYARGDIDILDSRVESNGAHGLDVRESGDQFQERLYVDIEGSTFSSNAIAGLLIYADAEELPGTVVIEKTTASDNGDAGLSYYGGNNREEWGPTTLNVEGSTFARNDACGVYLNTGGEPEFDVAFKNSTISGNTTLQNGGGIRVGGGDLDLTLTNVTITNNQAGLPYEFEPARTQVGGGIWFEDSDLVNGIKYSSVVMVNSIISGNTDGFGNPDNIWAQFEPLTPPDQWAPITSALESKYNLIGFGNTPRLGISNGQSGNKIAISAFSVYNDPLLTPLGGFGGITETHAPLFGSPVIDAGDPSTPVVGQYDQRGTPFQRGRDGNLVAGSVIDIGAFEQQLTPFLVTNTLPAGSGSLRQAVLNAKAQEATTGWNHITFQFPTAPTPQNPAVITINSTQLGEILINSNLQIAGPTANPLGSSVIIDGAYNGTAYSRLFNVQDDGIVGNQFPGFVMINDVTMRKGNNSSGAAVRNVARLTLEDAVVTTNTGIGIYSSGTNSALRINRSSILSNSSGGLSTSSGTTDVLYSTIASNTGYGVQISGTSNFDLFSSTVSNNTGHGIYSPDNIYTGRQTFRNSTISTNGGDGIYFLSTALSEATQVLNSTIAFNATAGIRVATTSANQPLLMNSIVSNSGNGTINDIVGQFNNSSYYNLIRRDSVTNNGIDHEPSLPFGTGNRVGQPGYATYVEPLLGALAFDNSHLLTKVHRPASGSQAVNNGDPNAVAGQSGISKKDQGNVIDRILGGTIDIGAVEYNPSGSRVAGPTLSPLEISAVASQTEIPKKHQRNVINRFLGGAIDIGAVEFNPGSSRVVGLTPSELEIPEFRLKPRQPLHRALSTVHQPADSLILTSVARDLAFDRADAQGESLLTRLAAASAGNDSSFVTSLDRAFERII